MKAVVFKGPHKVVIEDRMYCDVLRDVVYHNLTRTFTGPIPKIQEDGDIIVKVEYTALCGR